MPGNLGEIFTRLLQRQQSQDAYSPALHGGTVYTESQDQREARDNIQSILSESARQGTPAQPIVLPETPLWDQYADQLREWNRKSGIRPGAATLESQRKDLYVLKQLTPTIRSHHPGLDILYEVATEPDQMAKHWDVAYPIHESFNKNFPFKGDPLRYGTSPYEQTGNRIRELFGKTHELLYMINEGQSTAKEQRDAFGDISHDWFSARHFRMQQPGFRGAPAPPFPLEEQNFRPNPTDNPPTYDQYLRWLDSGGLRRDDNSQDPDLTSFLRSEEMPNFNASKGLDMFRYAFRKMPTYVARRRLEQLTRVPIGRTAQPINIASGLTHRQDDSWSDMPDTPEFGIRDLVTVSPFANWAVLQGQNFTTADAARIAKTRSQENWSWKRELDPTVTWREDPKLGLAPPVLSDWLGGHAIQIGMAIGSAGHPVSLGLYGGMMAGIFDKVSDVTRWGLLQYGRGVNQIRNFIGKDEIPLKKFEDLPFYLSRFMKEHLGNPSLEIAGNKEAYQWLAQHYGIDDPEEMARYLDAHIPAHMYIKAALKAASEFKIDKFQMGGPAGVLQNAAQVLQFPLQNEALQDSLSHFAGEPIDDTSVAALYLGLGPVAGKISRWTGATGWPSGVPNPIDRVSFQDLMSRDHLMTAISNEIAKVRDPALARTILTRATDEALLTGPLDPPFAAKIKTALQLVADSEKTLGTKNLSAPAKEALRDFVPEIMNVDTEGPSSAWWITTGKLPRFTAAESARFAGKITRLLGSIEAGFWVPPLESGRLKGSAGAALSLTDLHGSVKAALDAGLVSSELQSRYVAARDMLKNAITSVDNEIPEQAKTFEAKRGMVDAVIDAQKQIIEDLTKGLEDDDAGRGFIRRPHEEFDTPLYKKILALRQNNTFSGTGVPGFSELTEPEIRRIGGQDLIDEIAAYPGLREALIRSAAGRYVNMANTPTLEAKPPNPDGPRTELYASIRKTVAETKPGSLVELPPYAMEALQEGAEGNIYEAFRALRTRVQRHYADQVVATRRLRFLQGPTGMRAQLQDALDNVYSWWKDRERPPPEPPPPTPGSTGNDPRFAPPGLAVDADRPPPPAGPSRVPVPGQRTFERGLSRDTSQGQVMERIGRPREDLDYTLGSSEKFAGPQPPERAGFEMPGKRQRGVQSKTPFGTRFQDNTQWGGLSKAAAGFLKEFLGEGETPPGAYPSKAPSVVDEIFSPLKNRWPKRANLRTFREVAERVSESADLLTTPETVRAHARKLGLSEADTDALLLEKGAQKLGFLDQLVMWNMAQRDPFYGSPASKLPDWLKKLSRRPDVTKALISTTPNFGLGKDAPEFLKLLSRYNPFVGLNRYRNALLWNIQASAREGQSFKNNAMYKASRLIRAWSHMYRPEEMLHLMDTLRTGQTRVVTKEPGFIQPDTFRFENKRDSKAVAQWQRFLFEMTADALKANIITEQDFVDYYGRDGYYHGVFNDPGRFAQLSAGASPYPIPGRFRQLEVHPVEFSFSKPEDSFYVAWRKNANSRTPVQYRDGFTSAEEAYDWLDSDYGKEQVRPGYQVAVHSPWKLPAKIAAGLQYEPTISVANLARGMGLNMAAAFIGQALRDSPFVLTPQAALTRLSPEAKLTREQLASRNWSLDSDGNYWIRMNDDSVPHLKGSYVNEHAVQWLNMQHPSMKWIHGLLEEWQKATGIYSPDIPNIRNPLVPFLERVWNVSLGRSQAITTAADLVGRAVGNFLALSKVLVSLPSLSKQWISNFIFNIPAMLRTHPGDPFMWADIFKYGLEGLKGYTYKKDPGSDPTWDILFRNQNIEITGGSFSRTWHRLWERNAKSAEALTSQLERARADWAKAATASYLDERDVVRYTNPKEVARLGAHVLNLIDALEAKKSSFIKDIATHTLRTVTDALKATLDAPLRGRGPLTDGLFYAFGLPDQISKYIAYRSLTERYGLSPMDAISRIDAYGQNLHRMPEAIKNLATKFGGTKFTSYPYQQAVNIANILRNQPIWALGNLALLYSYNNSIRNFRGDNQDEMRELYGRTNYGGRSGLTDAAYNFGRFELPLGGYLELDGIWGILNGYSPFARSVQDLIKSDPKRDPDTVAILDAVAGLASHFVLGSVPLSLYASAVSKRDPYGEPATSEGAFGRALFKTLLPDLLPPYGRDYMYLTQGPEIDPKTNKPRSNAEYWARRFAQYHPPSEMESPARLKAAMDSVLRSDGTSGRFYGDMAYYDLLEVKARARGGPMKPDGTVDTAALEQLVRDHYASEGVQRSFAGLGDNEEPDPKNERFIQHMVRDVQEPRLIRNWRHLNAAQTLEAYAVYRAVFDSTPDPGWDERIRLSFGRELLNKQPVRDMQMKMANRLRYWESHQEVLPPGVLDTLRGWVSAAVRKRQR